MALSPAVPPGFRLDAAAAAGSMGNETRRTASQPHRRTPLSAYLIVRAEVPEAHRQAFDTWYEKEHLPDAIKAFGALSARRGWSDVTPGVPRA